MSVTLIQELLSACGRYISQTCRIFARHANLRESPPPLPEPMLGAAEIAPRAPFHARLAFDWMVLSDPSSQLYGGGPTEAVLGLLTHEPKFVLDVGCSIGDFSSLLKTRYPQARVWGVEPNDQAATMARHRLERVLSLPVEEIDWRKEGVQRGDIDTVLLFDVLEHIYNPWKTLLALRNLVSDTAQLLVSIPNVRNALLIQDLASGHWRYRKTGLLDITHIRFFARQDMIRMFYQTGFRVIAASLTRCPLSDKIFQKYISGPFPQVINLHSVSITAGSLQELSDLCTLQHFFSLQPVDYEDLSADERQWIDASHPPTVAYGS